MFISFSFSLIASSGVFVRSTSTNNPYASLLSGAASNPAFTQLVSGLFGGSTPVNALDYSAYGTGNAGFQNMLNDIYG